MSIKYLDQIRAIDSKKADIARAIALAVAEGNDRKFNEYYDGFKDILENKTRSFFVEIKDFSSIYKTEVKAMLEELSKFVGKNIGEYIFKEGKYVSFKDIKINSNIEKSEVEKLFDKNKSVYESLGIYESDIHRLYNDGGKEKIKGLNKLIEKFRKKTFMFDLKEQFCVIKESLQMIFISKQFDKLKAYYKLRTLDDLLVLHTEVASFLIDESKLNREQREIVEKNRNSYRKRVGVNEDFYISKKDVLKLNKEIEKIYNFNIYKQMFDNTNIKDFFELYGYEYNSKNIRGAFRFIVQQFTVTGTCTNFSFDNNDVKHCFFNYKILEDDAESQNNIILHEFIHALEILEDIDVSFCARYRFINEAMTEYLANKASKYLNNNILSDKENKYCKYGTLYDSMLPLVERFSSSIIWDEFVKVKFYGNLDKFESKIGYNDLYKISMCFDEAFKLNIDDIEGQKRCVEKLDGIIKKVEKKYKKEIEKKRI